MGFARTEVTVCVVFQIWMYQNLIKHSSLFVQQLDGSERLTCLFQIKRLMSLGCR